MNYYIFRNDTVERFFSGYNAQFSGYEDISLVPKADRYIWFYLAPLKLDSAAIADKIRNYADLFRLALSRVDSNQSVVAFTIRNIYGVHTITSDSMINDAVSDYNASLYAFAHEHANVKIVDFASFLNHYSDDALIDWKYYFISQMGLNPRLANDFKHWFAAQLSSIEMKRKKCLVLDMDNTLWGGVLGEDGIEGIKLGGDYPGKAFLMFQHQIKELEHQGVILAACSKNNLDDVRELWARHPDCVLKESDFAILKINWINKADNIRQIAEELNIGTDSMVFVDDNPTERALIKSELPEVSVPDFPEQPYLLPVFLKTVAEKYFAIYSLMKEDLVKTEQYKANAQRNSSKAQFTDMTEYIRSLEIELTIAEVSDITLPRVAQMTQKTNQFNLTTKRYTDADLRRLMSEDAIILTLSVKDKFGDSGITGAAIVTINGTNATFDSFLLSCRILGKGIETAFVASVLQRLQHCNIERVDAVYIPTAKNSQVADFYDKNGFTLLTEDNGTKSYSLQLRDTQIILSDNYKYV